MSHMMFFTDVYKASLIYCFKYNKVVCGDVSNIKVFLYFCLSKVELGFHSGDIIYVLGDMDQDGFYYVSVSTIIVY